MDAMGLIPAAQAIPTPWGWFEALSLVTFSIHLLLVNVVLGGACLVLVGRIRALDTGDDLAPALPTALGLAVNMAIPPLLFLQVLYGQFLYTTSVLSAWFWVSVAGLAMAAYFLLYANAWRVKRQASPSSAPLVLACALLLAVSFIMTNVMTLMIAPQAWTRYFDSPGGWLLNLGDPTLAPRWLHFVLASLAVGGLVLALVNGGDKAARDASAAKKAAFGLRWFTHASLAQLAVGSWFLVSLPREVMLLFMGRSGVHTAVFVLSLAGVGVMLWFAFRGRAVAVASALAPVTLLMVGLRDMVKAASVSQAFSPDQLRVTGQYGPMVWFFISLGVSLWLMVHMVGLYRKSRGGR